jgi:hypothetical protein
MRSAGFLTNFVSDKFRHAEASQILLFREIKWSFPESGKVHIETKIETKKNWQVCWGLGGGAGVREREQCPYFSENLYRNRQW